MGPTGSGKSALALAVAKLTPTVIINADAMQMVDGLRIITARPTVEEEAQAEHALYGVLPARQPTSVTAWLALAVPVIERAWVEGKLPLIVGGTGMYVQRLKEGIAAVPPIPEALRSELRALPAEEVRVRLEKADPDMAAKLKPGDSQRNLRALEVLAATGKSLAYWQAQKHAPFFPDAIYDDYYIAVEKPVLYPRLNARFAAMMRQGALEEVRALMTEGLPEENPIFRAHGVPELAAYLQGTMTLEDAIAQAQQNTRNYAKRQQTWIRNQIKTAVKLSGTAVDAAKIAQLN